MPDDFLGRVRKIAAEVSESKAVEVSDKGEGYYAFEITDPEGAGSRLPPIWIAPGTSDQQIKDKLSREFHQAFHPESDRDDLSVPNLQTEGKVH
jgi:hypothetical protein